MAKPDVLRSSSFHASFVGLLKLDYEYTGVDGGIDDETALGFPVRAVTVRGLTFERAQAGELTPGLEAAFKEAVLALQKGGGLIGIAGNCGFMMFYQQLVRRLASVPCFMSPLMQAPLISGALPPTGKILLLTANKSSLLAARKVLLTEAAVRVDDPEQFLIEGLDDLDGFETVANPTLGKMDQPKVEAGILERVRKIIATTPIRAVLSECTELPAFSDALRCATSLPVYDVVTCLNFFSAASMPSFAATMLKQQQLHQAAAAAAKQEALVLPPVRNEERALREDARKLTRTQLEMAMDAVHFLERELLIDPLEAEVNDVTGSNVAATVWSRLETLSRAVPMLKGSTTTDTLNEADLWKSYLPLALALHQKRRAHAAAQRAARTAEAFVVGLNAPPGCGKSTLVQLLRVLLRAAAANDGAGNEAGTLVVAHVSSDDLYMTQAQRQAAGVPNRLDVRSIDGELAESVLWALKRSTGQSEVRIPRFNKGLDEREDETLWTVQRGKVDVVLYEGWRVGVDHPDYARFNEAIDCLVCLDADADAIREWKVESSRRDALAAGKPFDEAKIRKAFDEQIMPFVNIYEKPLLARADLVLKKEASHAIQRFDRSLVDKLEAVAERAAEAQRAAGDASGQLPLSVVEEALSSLGLRSASRWVWELLARRGVRHTLTKEQFVSVLSVAVDSSTSAGAASFWFRQPRVRRASKGAVVAPGAPPFRCASGTSKLKHTADAAAAAAAQIAEALAAGDEPSVLVVYVTANHDAHALRATLRALYPRALLHGCTSCGGVMSHRGALADAGAHALALYAICDAGGGYATAYAVAPDGSAAAAEAAGVEAALGSMRGLHAGVTAAEAEPPDVLYVSSFPAREEDVLRGIGSVYGGSAADDDLTGGWWLLTGEDVVRPPAKDAAGVLVTAMSPTVHVAITLTALHAQTRHSGVVTAAGADGRTIEKIDGRPAAEVYDEWCDGAIGAKLRGGGDAPQNILGETTCFPLARQIEDGDGQTAHHLIHPSFVHPPTGAMETFADVREGETLLLMNAKEEAIVGAVGGATSKAVAWAGPGFERPSGAMVIYCAGCFLATRPHIGLVAESIRRGLASGGRGKRSGGTDDSGGGCAFVGGFTYGEQGPIGENTHANLMYNVLLFGEAKPAEAQLPFRQPSAEELARSTASALSEATVLKQMLAQATKMGDAALVTQLEAAAAAAAEAPRPQAQLLEELRDFLMHNGVYQSLLQLFADLDASGLTKVRLADFHRHLTQKLGFGLRDDEWTGLAQVLDADGDGTLSYGEIFAGLQEAASPTKLGRQRSKGPRPFGRTTSRTAL